MTDTLDRELNPAVAKAMLDELQENGSARVGTSKRIQLVNAWVYLTKAQSLNSEMINYLLDGFKVLKGEPLYLYAKESGNKVYNRVRANLRVRENKKYESLYLFYSLLLYELIGPSSNSSVDDVATCIDGFTPQNTTNVLANRIAMLLIRPLAKSEISEAATLTTLRASKLLSNLQPGIDYVIHDEHATPEQQDAAHRLQSWLQSLQPKDLPASNADMKLEEHNLEASEETRGGTTPDSDPSVRLASMDAVITYLKEYKKHHQSMANRLKSTMAQLADANKRIMSLEEEVRELQEENLSLRDFRDGQSRSFQELKNTYDALMARNSELSSRLTEAEEMLSMIDEREAHQADTLPRVLARDLRHDYRMFCDSLDMQMDAELGEIMRDELRSVFGILKRDGIEL